MDLDEIAAYLQTANPHVAIRFLEAADRTFARLAAMPGLGSSIESDRPALTGTRLWPVRGFKNHLILYRTRADGIEVIRIVHGSRDLESLFGA